MLHRPQLVSGAKRFLQTLPAGNSAYPAAPLALVGNALNSSTTSSPWISHSLPSLSRAKPFAARMNNKQNASKKTGSSASPQPQQLPFLGSDFKPITLEYPPTHQSSRAKGTANSFARALKKEQPVAAAAAAAESQAEKATFTTAAPAAAAPSLADSTATASTTAKRPVRKFRPRKAAITVTPNALAHVKQLLEGPNPKLLKIGVRNRGCSGLTYHLEYVDKPGPFDEEVMQDGVKVLIDSKALFSIIGSQMDYVDDKLTSRFVFSNPNSKGQCGCGESFMV